MYAHQQLFWAYTRDRDVAHFRPLSQQRQQAGTPWPTFPHQMLPEEPHTMEDNGDNA